MTDSHKWWLRLTPETRHKLMDDPDGPVPPDLVGEVTEAGQLVIGTWWPATQDGPNGMYLSQKAARAVERASLARAYSRASAARVAAMDEYFVPPDFDGGAVLDDEAMKRLEDLRRAEEDAARAWHDCWDE
jgi:hypothetical protein